MKQDSEPNLDNQRAMSLPSAYGSHLSVERSHHHRKFANPGPLGLASFAATTFLLSLFNVQARGIKTENLILSMAFSYGGLVQLLSGMWEFACGNTFGATAFSSYGAFWISFGLILHPSTGILSAYTSKTELDNALGLYLFTWFIFTTIMLITSLRLSVALVGLFFFLDITFMLLGVGKFYPETQALTQAGGIFGLITAFIAWYVAASGLLAEENGIAKLPLIPLGTTQDKKD